MKLGAENKSKPVLKVKKKKRVTKPILNIMGWNSTDVDEIERRRFRGQTEKMKSRAIEPEHAYFGSFTVDSEKRDKTYTVEIRSLAEHINSCDCPDYTINGLGTCKHIEYVLFRLQKSGKKIFKKFALEGGSRVEIYIDRREASTMRIIWPKDFNSKSNIRMVLEGFFNSEGVLQIEPVSAYSQILDIISGIKRMALKNKIRLSRHITNFIEHQRLILQRKRIKEDFLTGIEQDKYKVDCLKFPLYPYQERGSLHLALTGRALLADEMGLGKTVQAIAACELLYKVRNIKKALVVATTSLKAEWAEQINKFSDRQSLIIQGARANRLKQYESNSFYYLTNYEQIIVDGFEIQQRVSPDVIILDEAQRIKNWQTKTANAVKLLKSPYAFVLTGTPLENRIDDIYSVVQFIDPHFFGPLFRFNRNFYQLDEEGRPEGYKNLDELYRKLSPLMLRRRKGDVEGELPERTVNNFFVSMDKEQRFRYEEYQEKVAYLLNQSRRRPLRKEEHERMQKLLACMRMMCDSPYILDQECKISPKIHELKNVLEELLIDPTAKIIIFSEWERMLQLVRELVQKLDVDFAWHTGSLIQHKRRQEINRFKEQAACRLFLSTDAGSLGLNLQTANIVINLDLPWNPAKFEQRIARAWSKHQTRTVRVINFISQDSIEHRMLHLLSQKQTLAQGVLDGSDELKEMRLPSGRAAFMERMESLMSSEGDQPVASELNDNSSNVQTGAPVSEQEHIEGEQIPSVKTEDKTEPAQGSTFKTEAEIGPLEPEKTEEKDEELDRFSQHINRLVQEATDTVNNNHCKVLAIVDEHSENQFKQALVLPTIMDASKIEIIDNNTFELLQRLAQAGVLTLNPFLKILPASQAMAESMKQIQERQIESANQSLTFALRKQRMALILMEQEFLEEMIAPLHESLESALVAFSFLISEESVSTKTKINEHYIKQTLIAQHGLPQKTCVLWAKLKGNENSFLNSDIQNLYVDNQFIIDWVRDKIENYSIDQNWPLLAKTETQLE
jgi:superfamily II DNA/RNA helicase